jgi:hypothetical protein
LQTTTGMAADVPDLGGEADLVSSAGERPATPTRSKRWRFGVRGYVRAPVTVGVGPRNDGTPGHELHSEARVPGSRPNQWNYSGLTPPTETQLALSVENGWVAGHVFIESASLGNAGYENLLKVGALSDAYVTLKFADLFGERGGVAVNVGAFSHRYGVAGPNQSSSGYYGTYLFGRLRVAGEAITADVDLSDRVELIVEHGFGAKVEVMPFTSSTHNPPPPVAPYLPYQGPAPQGSNFVHHAHAALVIDQQLRIAAHYMTSWTPNDWRSTGETWQAAQAGPAPEGRITVVGGEVHYDNPIAGNGYAGYSHVTASKVLPLSNGLEVINSRYGYELADNYFGPLPASFAAPVAYTDSGSIDTGLFQYLVRLAPILGYPRAGRDLGLGVYSMLNYVSSDKGKQTRMKWGADLEASVHPNVAIGVRFDQVMPNGSNAATKFSAISPRVTLHSNWLSREYVIIDYTRYFYGRDVHPGVPYTLTQKPDPNMFMVSAIASF